MRTLRVIGNWKLHGSRAENHTLLSAITQQASELTDVELAICPTHLHIPAAAQQLANSNLVLGAQNLSDAETGAFTGEISASMLAEYDCKYVIIGHSERRHLYNESQDSLNKKVKHALAAGLTPVYCVGESQAQRESDETEKVIANQLDPIMQHVGIAAFENIVIAYEPVWAIGTGLAATTAQAEKVHAFIRQRLAHVDVDIANQMVILYGGSVKPENAAELFAQENIDGGLIGGASLNAKDFIAIAKAAITT